MLPMLLARTSDEPTPIAPACTPPSSSSAALLPSQCPRCASACHSRWGWVVDKEDRGFRGELRIAEGVRAAGHRGTRLKLRRASGRSVSKRVGAAPAFRAELRPGQLVLQASLGICRVFGYAHSTRSIPTTGHIAIQHQRLDGMRNITFHVTMKTYPYSEAPSLEDESTPSFPDDSVQSYETGLPKDEELDYDSEVLREDWEWQRTSNLELDRQMHPERYPQTPTTSSSSDYPIYQRADGFPAPSFESDRSGYYANL